MNSSRLLRAGAIFHWTPTTWADAYRDFTITGTPEIRGGVAAFDGANDYLKVSVKDWRSADSSGSIVARIKAGAIGSVRTIFASCDESTTKYQFFFQISSAGKVQIGTSVAGTFTYVTGDTVLTQGSIYTIIVTSSGTAWTITVNEHIESLTAFGSNTGNWFSDVAGRDNYVIGANVTTGVGNRFGGSLYDLAIFPRALSATEIANISKGDPFPWPRIVYHNYNIDGVTKTHEPFSSAQLTNILANLKSDGASALGLTTLDIADISREYGVA